jgi:excisionase family DNA binding protein
MEAAAMNEHISTRIQGARQATPELLTDQQAAEILAVEPRTIRLWRQTRGLPHIKITSKVIRFRRPDLDAWLERRRTVIGRGN